MNKKNISFCLLPALIIFFTYVEAKVENIKTKPILNTALNIEEAKTLTYFKEKIESVKRGKNKFSLVVNIEYELDFQSGKIKSTDTSTGNIKNYCPTPQLVNKLAKHLKNSTVCEYEVLSSEMCAQVIKNPVVVIKTANQVIELDGATDSCGRGKRHLCTAEMIENLDKDLKSLMSEAKLSKFNCKK